MLFNITVNHEHAFLFFVIDLYLLMRTQLNQCIDILASRSD